MAAWEDYTQTVTPIDDNANVEAANAVSRDVWSHLDNVYSRLIFSILLVITQHLPILFRFSLHSTSVFHTEPTVFIDIRV